MIKRIIAFLVSVALVMAMLPLAALAEEETAVTPEKVGEAIEQAQSSAMDAVVANAASGQVQTAADEFIAVANEKLAENKLDDAQSVVEGANTDNAERAEAAQEAAKDAADAADQAKEDQKVATEAKKDAQEALEEAKDADTKGEAVNAAEKAEEASEAAKEAANDAIAQSAVASQKAQDAKAAYEAAEEAARKADEEAKALLESGLINMGEAEKRTAEAAQRAQEKYDEMVAAEKAAEEAATAAKAEADAAKEVLDTAAKELEQAIVDNAVNVAEKTATAVVTGAALAASKVAVEVAGKVVESYEGDLAELEGQVEELNTAIDEADAAIAQAQEKLEALDEDDADYPQAKAALEAAQAAKDKAQEIKDNAQSILDAKAAAEEAGTAQKMKDLQAAVAAGTATAEQKQELTKQVLGDKLSENQLGKIQFDETDKNVFWIVDGEGNLVLDENNKPQSYEVKEVDGVLQFHKREQKNKPVEGTLPYAGEIYNGDKNPGKNTATTVYKATDEEGNVYDVVIECVATKIPLTKKYIYTYTYKVDGSLLMNNNGVFQTGTDLSGDKKVYTLVDTSQKIFVTDEAALKTNSNTIIDKWADAENAEKNLAEKEQALEDAKEKFNAAEKTYNETKETLEGIKTSNGEIKVAKQEEVNALNQQVAELDKKLNGSLSDQIIRAVILESIGEESDVDLLDIGKEAAALAIKAALGKLTEADKERWEELKDLQGLKDTGSDILEVVGGLGDGKVTLDDVKNTINLLADSGVSAKTRQAILKAVEKTLDAAHAQAAKDLSKAIEDAKQELAEKGQAVGAAEKDYADKELIFLEAAAKETLAEAAVSNAANLKDKAVKAHEDAEAALKAYEELANNETDKSLVEAAEKAYEDARKKADEALKAANEAIKNAIAAAEAALKARGIANSFPEENSGKTTYANLGLTSGKTTYANLGLTIAKYAYSLLGPLTPDFSENIGAMTNPEFARLVYAHFGIKLDLSSTKPEDVAKNGVRIDNKMVKPGDLVCIHAENGMVGTFGIYYGEGTYVFYNETSREVELGTCAQITNGWFAVRVVW